MICIGSLRTPFLVDINGLDRYNGIEVSHINNSIYNKRFD